MPEPMIVTKKPTWSLDVKIINDIAESLRMAGEYAIEMEIGDPSVYPKVKAYLHEAYLKFGGDLEGDGNMLDSKMREQVENAFNKIQDWERTKPDASQNVQEIETNKFFAILDLLRIIRKILYKEQNRNFMKFVTIYSEEQKMQRYAHARTAEEE